MLQQVRDDVASPSGSASGFTQEAVNHTYGTYQEAAVATGIVRDNDEVYKKRTFRV